MSFYYYPFSTIDLIQVSNETCIHAPHTFFRDGTIWEYDAIKVMKNYVEKFLNNKGNFVDVGAQVGLYTLCAKFLPEMHFYAYEPFSKSCDLLKQNLALNNISNVTVYDKALSIKKGVTTLNTSKSHNGLHTLGLNPVRFSDVEKITIQTDSIDENADIEKIDYLKIDTEGWEYFVLLGGIKKIKLYPPSIIQLEINDENLRQCNINKSDLLTLLDNLGYKLDTQIGGDEHFFVRK